MLTSRTVLVVATILLAPRQLWALDEAPDLRCQEMAIAVIDSVIASLDQHPNQLSMTINASGVNVANSGGTGINIQPQVTGGTVGNLTGMQVGVPNNIQVVQGLGNEKAEAQSTATVAVLKQIREALQKNDREGAGGLLDQLKTKAVDVVYEVVKTAVLTLLFRGK